MVVEGTEMVNGRMELIWRESTREEVEKAFEFIAEYFSSSSPGSAPTRSEKLIGPTNRIMSKLYKYPERRPAEKKVKTWESQCRDARALARKMKSLEGIGDALRVYFEIHGVDIDVMIEEEREFRNRFNKRRINVYSRKMD